MSKKILITDFPVTTTPLGQGCIRWEDIEQVLGEEKFKKFCGWMHGQTTLPNGVYAHDLDRWLKGLSCID